MPEGPEIRTAANFINKVCESQVFAGPVVRGPLAVKLPVVNFAADQYTLRAEARGKELKIHLCDLSAEKDTKKGKKKLVSADADEGVRTLLFHFGMSGCFKFTTVLELPKHAHLQFHTKDKLSVLSFVDYRRFGSWKINGDWGTDRGPDPVTQYQEFRQNVLSNLDDPAFNRAICEVLLNQKYFNGIGNYLRAEILFRTGNPPFEVARKILEPLKLLEDEGIKREGPDILDLCHSLPLEVLNLGYGKGYDVDHTDGDYSAFENWLQCYNKEGMKNMSDKNGRTIWFSGSPGPLKPANAKTKKRVVYKSKGKKEGEGEEELEAELPIADNEIKVEEPIDEKPDSRLTSKEKRKATSKRKSMDNAENNVQESNKNGRKKVKTESNSILNGRQKTTNVAKKSIKNESRTPAKSGTNGKSSDESKSNKKTLNSSKDKSTDKSKSTKSENVELSNGSSEPPSRRRSSRTKK